MAVKKPKLGKPNFDIGDILKFIDSQIVGDKARGIWQEGANIPMPNALERQTGAGQWLGGLSPTTIAGAAKVGKGVEGLANTGVGQWFGADSAFKLGDQKQTTQQQLGNMANILFSVAPLGGGGIAKKIKGAAKDGSVATKEMLSIIKMLMGMQGK